MANVKISDLTAAASVADANEFEINEAGTSKKVTGAQISAKVISDITATDIQTLGALMDSELTSEADVKALNQGVATGDSPQFAGVNVGHATDTTITRTGAGVIAVEGVEVTTNSGTQTLTNKTLTSPNINVTSDATGDIYYRTAGGAFARLGIGSTDEVLTVASGLPSWAAASGGGVDVQAFTSSGTWTKPGSGTFALVEIWGAGGGGGRAGSGDSGGGGGGGSYRAGYFLLSALGATETVTIGAGGTGGATDNTNGTAGGNSTFGSHLTGYGGGYGFGNTGSTAPGGGGGGIWGAGSNAVDSSTGGNGGAPFDPGPFATDSQDMDTPTNWGVAGSWSGRSGQGAGGNIFGGGGGGAPDTTDNFFAGGASIYGGGGGGGGVAGSGGGTGGKSEYGGAGGGGGASDGTPGGGAGGTSTFGGNGGAGGQNTTAGTNGTQPGGGGGGSESAVAGDGGDGYCRVTVF